MKFKTKYDHDSTGNGEGLFRGSETARRMILTFHYPPTREEAEKAREK